MSRSLIGQRKVTVDIMSTKHLTCGMFGPKIPLHFIKYCYYLLHIFVQSVGSLWYFQGPQSSVHYSRGANEHNLSSRRQTKWQWIRNFEFRTIVLTTEPLYNYICTEIKNTIFPLNSDHFDIIAKASY